MNAFLEEMDLLRLEGNGGKQEVFMLTAYVRGGCVATGSSIYEEQVYFFVSTRSRSGSMIGQDAFGAYPAKLDLQRP